MQPFFFSSAMTFFWLNFHRAYGVAYAASKGLWMLLCRTGITWVRNEARLDVQHLTDLRPVNALNDGLPNELLLQRRMSLRALLKSRCSHE